MSLLDPPRRVRLELDPRVLRGAVLVGLSVLILAGGTVLARHPTLRPDFAALLVVYFALEHHLLGGLGLTLAVGYVADVFAGESRGLYTSSLVLTYLVLRLVVLRVLGARWFLVTGIAVAGSVLALVFRLLIEAVLGPGRTSLAGLWPAVPAILLGAVLFGYPCFRLLRAVGTRLQPREEPMFSPKARGRLGPR